MKIVALSDTHNNHNKLVIPECDILIHVGDYSYHGYDWEILHFYQWLEKQPAKYKISIQGNHEEGWEKDPISCRKLASELCPGVVLLNNETVEIEGIKIFGSPWTPYFHNWAYNGARIPSEAMLYNKPLLKDLWKDIQEGTDIIATHGPPYEILDELTYVDGTPKGQFVGCVDLKERILEVKPDLFFCGHIHCAHGEKHIDGTSFYNVSICDEIYYPSNPITVVEYEK